MLRYLHLELLMSIAVGLVAVLPCPVRGQSKAEARHYAILIGVASYESPVLRKLSFAENDVTDFAKVLRGLGYSKDDIVLMTATESATRSEPRFNPTAKNIREELDLYLSLPRQGDTLLVAFAGHGVQFAGDKEHYFCPVDADLKDKKNLISIPDIYQRLEKCRADTKLLFVDACRNDPLTANVPRGVSKKVVSKTRPVLADPPGGVGAFFSCSKGQEAFESEGLSHGVFFHFVLNGLRGKAVNPDKRITVGSLVEYVSRRVPAYTVRHLRAKQQPELLGRINPNVILGGFDKKRVQVAAKSVEVGTSSKNKTVKAGTGSTFTNRVGMEFVRIPNGAFVMGSPKTERSRLGNEVLHDVEISEDFFIGVTEVTQEQYKQVVGSNPSAFAPTGGIEKVLVRGKDTGKFPVERVSWSDAVAFCKALNELAKEKGEARHYRLPTEAEWEYVCRAGAKPATVFHFGNALGSEQANFNGKQSYGGAPKGAELLRTARVKSYAPNAFGVYDMHGNVMEWCSDWYDQDSYSRSPKRDPKGPTTGQFRVLRGGSWNHAGHFCRSAKRDYIAPSVRSNLIGFRVVCVPAEGR